MNSKFVAPTAKKKEEATKAEINKVLNNAPSELDRRENKETVPVSVYFPKELFSALEEGCRRSGINKSAFIKNVVSEKLISLGLWE